MTYARSAIVMLAVGLAVALAGCGNDQGRGGAAPERASRRIMDDHSEWETSPAPGDAGNLNPPSSSGGRLRISHDNAVENRRNGHPDSKGVKTIDCGGGGGSCDIEYAIGGSGGYEDNERLKIKFTNGGVTREVTHGPPDTGTQHYLFPACGTITIEVTVDPGDHPEDVASWFDINLISYACQ